MLVLTGISATPFRAAMNAVMTKNRETKLKGSTPSVWHKMFTGTLESGDTYAEGLWALISGQELWFNCLGYEFEKWKISNPTHPLVKGAQNSAPTTPSQAEALKKKMADVALDTQMARIQQRLKGLSKSKFNPKKKKQVKHCFENFTMLFIRKQSKM